jgi:hypothetical protein
LFHSILLQNEKITFKKGRGRKLQFILLKKIQTELNMEIKLAAALAISRRCVVFCTSLQRMIKRSKLLILIGGTIMLQEIVEF